VAILWTQLEIAISHDKTTNECYLSLLLHRAFWRFTEYYTPTNAL